MTNPVLLNTVIVDDEPLAIKGLSNHLKSFDFIKVTATFGSSIEASKYLESNMIDLLFLDINMPKLNGLRMLESLSSKPMIIFTTAHPHHALEAFENDAIDFLLKPYTFEKLVKAINKALLIQKTKSIDSSDFDYRFIRSDGQYHKLYFNDILYVEGMKDYVKVHSETEVFSVAMNLVSIGDRLPQDTFIRSHKSYIINKKKITKLDNSEIMLGSVTLPIGGVYRETLRQEVLSFHMIKK